MREERSEMNENPFYRMIKNLFLTEDLVLYGQIDTITEAHAAAVLGFLSKFYQEEAVGYPGAAPEFHQASADWSAKILFHASQLVMYRAHSGESLIQFIPPYEGEMTPAAMITADLCLRFIPSILAHLEQIDLEDELIPLLKALLRQWHFSGLLSDVSLEGVELDPILQDECLTKLYIDRIIEQKKKKVGQRLELKPLVQSALGNYENQFWKDFSRTI